jgi:hypothetical protein
MANSPEQEKVMNAAADKFMQDLRVLLVESKPDDRKAIGSFVDLIDKHYLEAGYKRIVERSRNMRPVMK